MFKRYTYAEASVYKIGKHYREAKGLPSWDAKNRALLF